LDKNGEEVDPRDVPGYYTKKVKYSVKSVNDFIGKLRRTAVCDKFLRQHEQEYCGLSELF